MPVGSDGRFHMPDSWYDPPEEPELLSCLECGEDFREGEPCGECGYEEDMEPDWDAIAEAKAEAALDREESYYNPYGYDD